MTDTERGRIYRSRLSAQLRAARGNTCQGDSCHETAGLEWAHTKPTKVRGWGRGSGQRLRDVREHPRAYLLLCPACHGEQDGKIYNRPYATAESSQEEAVPF